MSVNIYQNILASNFDRADLCILDSKKETTAQNFTLQLLQQGRIDFELHSTFQAAGILQYLFFESRNQEKNIGDKLLGFGFPMLFTQINGENYAAPLFVWRLGIEPSVSRINSWVFRHNDSYSVEVNLHLLDALQRAYDTDFSDVLFDFGVNNRLEPKDLQRICANLSNQLNLAHYQAEIRLVAQPSSTEVRKLTKDGGILWSGSIGLFPPQWKSEKLPAATVEMDWSKLDQLMPPQHSFGLKGLTPGQSAAVKLAQSRRITQVNYLYQTDQVEFINHLITNALSQDEKCLIVAPNATTLRNIQAKLVQQQISYAHFLLKEPISDKSLLLELLKALDNSKTMPPVQFPAHYQKNLEKCLLAQVGLDANFTATQRIVFGNESWTYLVGHFLRSNRTEDKALLNNHLQATDFTFTFKEYESLRTAVEICKPLYQNISTLKHPLGELNADIFTQKTEAEGLQFIQEKTAYFLKKGKELQHKYISGQAAYSERLRAHYENRQTELLAKAERVLTAIDEQEQTFGIHFQNASTWSLKLRGFFSGKFTRILEAREGIRLKYERLQQVFQQYNYFDFNFATATPPLSMPYIQRQTKAFIEALQNWKNNINEEVREEVKRLSFQTALPGIEYRQELKKLEDELEELVKEINDTRLLDARLENKMLTLGKQQQFLESILEQMAGAQYNLRDFNSFYKWHRNWLQLDKQARKVVQALIKVQPKIWIAAFESWYFHQILLRTNTTELPERESALLNFAETLQDFRPTLLQHIRYTGQERRNRAIKSLKNQNKKTYQLIFGKKNHELCAERSLQEVLRLGLPTISEVLPVLLTTADVAAHDFPQLEAHFDYIIFVDSQQLAAETCTRLLPMGKRIVALKHRINHSAKSEHSLSDLLQEKEVLNVILKSPAIGTTNGAKRFFANLYDADFDLSLLEESADYQSLNVVKVEGRYNEKEQTNDVEAQRILTLLNEIKTTQQRTYPRVGIICFTLAQRNLIAAYLLKIKQKRSAGSEMIQHLERNGLSVLHIDELNGQQFDIVIGSLAYGTVDMHGTFTQTIQQLNEADRQADLPTLLNCVRQRLIIVHSIPEVTQEQFLDIEAEKLSNLYLLLHFLKYAEAVQRKQTKAQFDLLADLHPAEQPLPPQIILAEEISAAVLPYLGAERLARNVVFNGLRIPLLILPLKDHQPATAVVPDGFFATGGATSYDWERQQRRKLEEMDFLYYPAWSVLWWKDTAQEARKLASWVIKTDKLGGEV
ncbi:MAG: AAA domain-containing protein [Saprospiraceae bacterium]